MLSLSEAEVYQILCTLSRPECQHFLSVLTATLTLFSTEAKPSQHEKLLYQPLRSSIVTKNNDTTLFMPCSDTNNTGIKIITLPAKQGTAGVNLVFSPTGQMLGLIGASQITAFRTALATMCLFVRVSHIPKRRIVVFGSGKQVEWLIRLVLLLVGEEVESFTVMNRGRKRLDELEKDVLSGLRPVHENVTFRLVAKDVTADYEDVVQEELGASDAIFCCTPSTEPLFSFSALQVSPKSRFISLIGSYKPHMKEIDTNTLLSGGGRVFVDTKEACLEESGELIDAKLTEKDLIEIGEHLGNGEAVYPEGNVVLKCVGMGLMDLVSSRLALDLARKRGLGQEVHGF